MTSDLDRFPRAVIETLAKRANNHCSNPDCNAITSGPAEDESRSITVGEAAHIYGAKLGAARYDDQMTAAERGAITNAIWLCCNCHKMIDSDPDQFHPDLLYEWRREHERVVSEGLGRTSDRLKRNLVDRQLIGFDGTSYMARQIVIDKPSDWEYRLTLELLRSKFTPLWSRWNALNRGLYARPIIRLSAEGAADWFQDRTTEIGLFVPALTGIINNEFRDAWGAPGKSGSPEAILAACDLFGEVCQQILNWEENIRFTVVPRDFEEVHNLLFGIGGRILDQVRKFPLEMSRIFSEEQKSGTHSISIVLDLPDEWGEQFISAFDRAWRRQ